MPATNELRRSCERCEGKPFGVPVKPPTTVRLVGKVSYWSTECPQGHTVKFTIHGPGTATYAAEEDSLYKGCSTSVEVVV